MPSQRPVDIGREIGGRKEGQSIERVKESYKKASCSQGRNKKTRGGLHPFFIRGSIGNGMART